jgi:tetratricopeptide (TPR) repeat protein
MKRKLPLVVLFAIAVAVGVSAQSLSVSYFDGVVELRTAKGWKALAIGDQVPPDGSVRISQSGSLELQRAKARIAILKDGIYDMASLVKATDKAGIGGVGTAIAQKLQSLTTEKPKTSAVGGTRGDPKGTAEGSGSVMWVDASDETRAEVQTLLDQKKIAAAITVLNEALRDSSEESTEKQEYSYLLGSAYYSLGQTARAYRTLLGITAQPGSPWYARYIILKGQVLLDTLNFKDALAVLEPFIAEYPTGEATQVAYLLASYCKKGLGDIASARSALDAGYQLNPSSDTAKLIEEQKKGL